MNLKFKKLYDISSRKLFKLSKSLTQNHEKLVNLSTNEKYVMMRSFSSGANVDPKLLFSSERSVNVKKSLFNFNFESKFW